MYTSSGQISAALSDRLRFCTGHPPHIGGHNLRGAMTNSRCRQAAIAGGKPALVRAVVEAGGRLDAHGRFGYPLRAAAVIGHSEIIEYLLEMGADPNAEDRELGDALQAAVNNGNAQVMLILLDNKADVNGRGGEFGDTSQAAAFADYEQAVRLLIERGAMGQYPRRRGPDYQGLHYVDALHAAIFAGQEHIVEVFLKNPGALPTTVRSTRAPPTKVPSTGARISYSTIHASFTPKTLPGGHRGGAGF